jgi:hypothetical protein
MFVDSSPQPCPQCARPTVLATYGWGRQWVHVGTWRPQCGDEATQPKRLADLAATGQSSLAAG